MKNLLMACFMAILALGVTVGNAEAARLGGSKSFGMQRQSVAPRPASPMQQATPVAPHGPTRRKRARYAGNNLGPNVVRNVTMIGVATTRSGLALRVALSPSDSTCLAFN